MIVDNKGGAGGNIAHQFVSQAVPDGTVLLFGSVGPLTIAPHLMKLPYDPFKDLAPISGGVYFPIVGIAGGSILFSIAETSIIKLHKLTITN